ncbi:MAG: hypothetical protein RL219_2298 [Actinomycetota bacterium]|jgi:hypothetical protein
MTARDQAWTASTLASLKQLADRWHGEWIQVSDTDASRVEQCPARSVDGSWPGWSSMLSARQVGLTAARTGIADAREAVREAVKELVASGEADRERQRVQDWVASLPRTARLDVADEAVRWLIAWRTVNPVPRESWVNPTGAARLSLGPNVSLRAAIDLLIKEPGSGDYTAYVSVSGAPGPNDDYDTAGRLAMVLWLIGTSVSTVMVTHPASRLVTEVPVTVDLVARAAEQFCAALHARITTLDGTDVVPELPDRNCRWCDRLERCDSGQQFLADHPEFRGGIAVLT